MKTKDVKRRRVHLDDESRAIAKAVADGQGITMKEWVSDLIRKNVQPKASK